MIAVANAPLRLVAGKILEEGGKRPRLLAAGFEEAVRPERRPAGAALFFSLETSLKEHYRPVNLRVPKMGHLVGFCASWQPERKCEFC